MNCSQARKLISGYVDNLLDVEKSTSLKRHLADCHVCAEQERLQRDLSRILDSWQAPEPALGFQDLLSRVPDTGSRRRMPGFSEIPRLATAALVAATVILGVAAGAIYQPDSPSAMAGVPTQKQVAQALGISGYDDAIETGIVLGLEPSTGKGGSQQ